MTSQDPQTSVSTPSDPASKESAPDQAQSPMTQGQAEEILAELKQVKQRLLWVLVIVGFFAARALFFHY